MGLRSSAKGKQVNLFHAASATVASDARLMAASYRQRLGLHAKVVSDKQDATFGLFWCNCRMIDAMADCARAWCEGFTASASRMNDGTWEGE
jgi:hypothetical protein